jgi:hypothetical protein
MAFLRVLVPHVFLHLVCSDLHEQMPEIIPIVQAAILTPSGTAKKSGQGALDHVFLIGIAQALASELGARQPDEPPIVVSHQLVSGSRIAVLDPTDQPGDAPRRGHGKAALREKLNLEFFLALIVRGTLVCCKQNIVMALWSLWLKTLIHSP